MLDAPAAAMTAQGRGPLQPTQPVGRDGVHDEAAATANWWIVIEIH